MTKRDTNQPTKGPHSAGTPGTHIENCVFAPGANLLGFAYADRHPDDVEGRVFVSADEAAANARLWATAWELLEVCKAQDAVEARVRTMNEVDWTAQRAEAEAIGAEVRRIKTLRAAAIAKATGDDTE